MPAYPSPVAPTPNAAPVPQPPSAQFQPQPNMQYPRPLQPYAQPQPRYVQPHPGYARQQPQPRFAQPQPMFNMPPVGGMPNGVVSPTPYGQAPGIAVPYFQQPMFAAPGLAPPPGTLGRTYRRMSYPLPVDKHPRIGMLEVTISKEVEEMIAAQQPALELRVGARDIDGYFKPMKGYLGTDGIWHFESKPLYPGIPHIFDVNFDTVRKFTKVEVRYGRRYETMIEKKINDLGYRRIRLIPGRIVTLTF